MNLALRKSFEQQAAEMIARRRAQHLDFTMMAEGDDPPKSDPPAGDPPKSDPPAGADAVDEQGNALGFPAKTPIAEMTDKQQSAYWRNESKKQQRIAESRADYDQNKADAEAYRAHKAEQQTPSEKAINDAKLEAKKEVAGDAAVQSLRAILSSRGKDDAELNDLLEFVSADRFVTTDGKVDHQKVTTYADKLAPTGSQGGGGGGFGQGRYDQPNVSRSAAGKAEAEKRFGAKK